MPDVGAGIDIDLDQQIELAGSGIDFRRDLGVGKPVRHLVGLAELAFDLHEEGDHGTSGRRARPEPNPAKSPASGKTSRPQPRLKGYRMAGRFPMIRPSHQLWKASMLTMILRLCTVIGLGVTGIAGLSAAATAQTFPD